MKNSPWDFSQLSGEDMDELRRIFRRRRNPLVRSDGLDAGNKMLNGIRPTLYEDISRKKIRSRYPSRMQKLGDFVAAVATIGK